MSLFECAPISRFISSSRNAMLYRTDIHTYAHHTFHIGTC